MTPTDYKKMYDIAWTYEGKSFSVRIEGYFANSEKLVGAGRVKGVHTAESWLIDALRKQQTAPIPSLRLASDRPSFPPLRLGTDQPHANGGSFMLKSPQGEIKTISKSTIANVFTGKASPSEIRDVLWAATHVGQIVSDPAKKGPQSALPQSYADMYIGVDCSGFAMNFLNPKDRSTIEDLDQDHIPERRQKLEDIQVADAMCFCKVPSRDYHHIAIVSSFQNQCEQVKINKVDTIIRTVYTVESNGGSVYSGRMQRRTLQGLSNHFYVITPKPKTPGVFLEVRGKTLMTGQEFYFHPAAFRGSPKL